MKRHWIVFALCAPLIIWAMTVILRGPALQSASATDTGVAELELRSRDIAFYEQRIAQDPVSAADHAQLAGLYLQRAREAGDYEDFRRAETAARKSWELRDRRNGKALHMLASALLAQHKFSEAHEAAERLVELDPGVVAWRALLAEIQLELGDYDAAAANFSGLHGARADLSVAPRLARWYEISGAPGTARILLRSARDTALHTPELPREQKAWFFLRLADLELRNGNLREAVREAQRGLQVNPGDVRLISVLARAAHLREDWQEVAVLIEPILDHADIATLALLGDAYFNQKGYQLAENTYARIEEMAAENPEPFNRQWTQFRLDHGREIEATVKILEREAEIRPDMLGYEMLARAYDLSGRYREAQAARMTATRTRRQLENLGRPPLVQRR